MSDEATMNGKVFRIGQVARDFFDQSASWFRWQERNGRLNDESGEVIGSRRRGVRQGRGDRLYDFDDIEELAEALHRNDVLSDEGRTVVLNRVQAMREPVEYKTSRRGRVKQEQEQDSGEDSEADE